MSRLFAGLWLCFALAWATPARADPNDRDRAAAVALFEQAKTLMDAQRYEEACPKFARALELAHGVGIQLNLALCYEKLGRTASAWTHHLQVVAETERAQDDPVALSRFELAKQRVAHLEPRLTRLLVRVEGAVVGQEVHRGAQQLEPAQWGVAIPVDPDAYEIHARAPGQLAWSTVADAKAEGGTVTVVVPPLEPSPDATPYHVGAAVAGGIGVVGIGVGVVAGVLALNKRAEADPYCNDQDQCFDPGPAIVDDATTIAHVSTAGLVVGGAALAAALVLWLLAPEAEESIAIDQHGVALRF